jgi:hypothetical protein
VPVFSIVHVLYIAIPRWVRVYLLVFSPKVTGLRNFAPSFPRLLIYKATPFFGIRTDRFDSGSITAPNG